MTPLIKLELRRFLARRLFKAASIAVIAGFTVAGVATFIASDDAPAAVRAAREQYEADLEECVQHARLSREIGDDELPARARRDPRGFCREQVWMDDPRFNYEEMNWMLQGLGLPALLMLGWLLGASFVGAEWSHRTMTLALTWEPRRIRLLLAKLVAAAVALFFWFLLVEGFFVAAMYPAAHFEGTLGAIDAGWWQELAGVAARIAGVGSLAGVFGAGIATIGRNTAAAFGGGFVYLAAIERLIHNFKPAWADWLVGDNLALVIFGADEANHLSHGELGATARLVAYALALCVAAAWTFRRRDLA